MIRVQDLDLSHPVAFLIFAALGLIDGVVPLVPARTAVIGLGVIAGTGDVRAYPLLAVATAAAFVSDNISYWLGARYWPRISRIVLRGARSRRVWAWVEDQLRRRGIVLVALARVVPGGPTPITLTAGSVHLPLSRFRMAAAISAVLWSAYAFGVGMFGDAVVGNNLLVALLAGLGLAGGLNLVLRMAIRRSRAWAGDRAAHRQRRAGPVRPPARRVRPTEPPEPTLPTSSIDSPRGPPPDSVNESASGCSCKAQR